MGKFPGTHAQNWPALIYMCVLVIDKLLHWNMVCQHVLLYQSIALLIWSPSIMYGCRVMHSTNGYSWNLKFHVCIETGSYSSQLQDPTQTSSMEMLRISNDSQLISMTDSKIILYILLAFFYVSSILFYNVSIVRRLSWPQNSLISHWLGSDFELWTFSYSNNKANNSINDSNRMGIRYYILFG